MNKVVLLFLIILLISDIDTSSDSECLQTKESSSRRRLESITYTEAECQSLSTSDDQNLICVLSSDKKSCDEVSFCLATQRVTSNALYTNQDCEDLPTTDINFYCSLSSNQQSCTEVEIFCDDFHNYYSRRRLSSESDLTQEDCNVFRVRDDVFYTCVLDTEEGGCKADFKNCKEIKDSNIRRLSSDLWTDDDCINFYTSDDSKYICVAKKDGSGCEEKKNGSNEINLSFALLCLFLFL